MRASYFSEDTVAAIASAPNVAAAVGVIRISGPDAWPVSAKILRTHSGGRDWNREKVQSHQLYRCTVVTGAGDLLDDGMFVLMAGPHSFTGEDVVELHLHGSPFLLRRVMQELIRSGAREALPGEFSFRAFRSGKVTLDQAESISDLISSQSEESAKRALGHLLGRSSHELQKLKRELVDRLAEVEVDIDFSDQGLSVLNYDLWAERLGDWCERVEGIRREFLESQPKREGIRLALVGAPNSGKSSLFNRLLGEDRSIVSQEAGTTRDVVREAIYLRGVLFRLSDTAGIRETENKIEVQGIDRSFGEVQSADLILWVTDGTEAQDQSVLESRWNRIQEHRAPRAKVISVWNKADLAPKPHAAWEFLVRQSGSQSVVVSAASGVGLVDLIDLLVSSFSRSEAQQPDFLISRSRHFAVLGEAVQSVKAAVNKVQAGERAPDLLSTDLRGAISHLGEITGEFSTEDLLHHIFAEFCIGK
jgi:tRNA modification GTPase